MRKATTIALHAGLTLLLATTVTAIDPGLPDGDFKIEPPYANAPERTVKEGSKENSARFFVFFVSFVVQNPVVVH